MFDKIFKKINIEVIKSFLESNKGPHYESTLMRLAFSENINFNDILNAYRCHFVLFNLLYDLQEKYYEENKYLHVHFMRINLIDYPEKNKCSYYDEYNGKFCGIDCGNNFCELHKKLYDKNLPEFLSSKHFYLEKNNFYLLNEKNAEAFIKGTWEIFKKYKEFDESFKVLGLSKHSSLTEIKRKFYKLSKETHPDLGGNEIERFIEINNAYHFLLKIYSIKI